HVRSFPLFPYATLFRSDLDSNPNPLLVVWAGPAFGVILPLLLWGACAALHVPGSFVLRFFAGFCLITNGETQDKRTWDMERRARSEEHTSELQSRENLV